MQINLPSTFCKQLEKLEKLQIKKKKNLFQASEGYQGSEELRTKIRDKKTQKSEPRFVFFPEAPFDSRRCS